MAFFSTSKKIGILGGGQLGKMLLDVTRKWVISTAVLEQLRDGTLNPMMAVMGGQIKISGDMGLAMKVQSLMG